MSSRRPIGIIDSGVGGLTVLRELRRTLPYEDFVYIADTANCPYGPKPAETIRARIFSLTDDLLARGAKLVVLACNSATIAAVGALREHCPVPVVGMEPAVKPAAETTRTGVVAVLATEASVAGEKFHRLVAAHAEPRGVRVITRPCPEFVALVEAGDVSGERVRAVVAGVLAPLLAAGADTLVLGCTHFPFLRPVIAEVAGSGIRIPDTGEAVARRVKTLLENDAEAGTPGGLVFLTSGDPEKVGALAGKLCPEFAGAWEKLA